MKGVSFVCFATVASIAAAILPIRPALAFKVDTHIWIAQEIINELESSNDESVEVAVGRQLLRLQIPPDVRRYILDNKEYYRMGHVGPDALPGILEGQLGIHPHEKGRWGTGKWLEHLLKYASKPEEVAFTYGVLGHAASDIWAHTYVNAYSGGKFSLLDGETYVESRHYILESYISRHLPPLVDNEGRVYKKPIELIRLPDNKYAIPYEFLYREFLSNHDAASELADSGAGLFLAVRRLNTNLESLTGEGGFADRIHWEIQKIVIQRITGYVPSRRELQKLNRLHQKYRTAENGAVEFLQSVHDEWRKMDSRIRNESFEAIDRAFGDAQEFSNSINGYKTELQNVEREIDNVIIEIEDKIKKDVVCRTITFIARSLGIPKRKSQRLCKTIVTFLPGHREASDLKRQLQDLEREIDKKKNDAIERFRETLREGFSCIDRIYQHETNLLNLAVDYHQATTENENPIEGFIENWIDGNKLAIHRYFEANVNTIENAFSDESMFDPLLHWMTLEAPKFTGAPYHIVDGLSEILAAIETADECGDDLLSLDPLAEKLLAEKQRIIEQVKEESIEAVVTRLNKDLESLYQAMKKPATEENMNEVFSVSTGEVRLLTIERIGDYVRSELKLDGNGHFDADNFAPIYNSLVLSKLTLLDADSLNVLTNGHYSYDGLSVDTNNILPSFVSDIDGDHHWLSSAPPYPRVGTPDKPAGSYAYDEGLPFWENSALRKEVFRKIFKGPINEGFATIDDRDRTPIERSANYPYEPTVDCPFPYYPAFKTCERQNSAVRCYKNGWKRGIEIFYLGGNDEICQVYYDDGRGSGLVKKWHAHNSATYCELRYFDLVRAHTTKWGWSCDAVNYSRDSETAD